MNRAVFLDRDNTIIHNDGDLGDPAGVKLIQGAASAIASMRGLGFRIVVVSNQGGVARGKYTEADVDATNQRIAELLRQQANGAVVDAFYYCPYHPEGSEPRYRREHPWRKPQPGMVQQAAQDLKLDLSLCWMIGDQGRDVEAGRRAGTRTMLLADPNALGAELAETQQPDFFARNLIEAARVVAQHLRPEPATPQPAPAGAPGPPTGEATTAPRPGATYPAVHDLGTPRSTRPQRRPDARPFKPWAIQPTENTARSPEPPTQPPPPRPEEAIPQTPSPQAQAPAAPQPQPAEPIADDQTTLGLLSQIVRLLKRHEATHGEWSLYKTLAVGVAQPLAGACVVIGLVSTTAITDWLLGAIGLQLLVVTLLILHGQD